jgi:hypothetical protein
MKIFFAQKKISYFPWWKQLIVFGTGYLVAFVIGIALISPTGPGSDRIFYVILLVYSLSVIIAGSRSFKAVGIILALVFLYGAISETRARNEYNLKMKERVKKLQFSALVKNFITPAEVDNLVFRFEESQMGYSVYAKVVLKKKEVIHKKTKEMVPLNIDIFSDLKLEKNSSNERRKIKEINMVKPQSCSARQLLSFDIRGGQVKTRTVETPFS